MPYATTHRIRRKGLPKRFSRIAGGIDGLSAEWDIKIGPDAPAAKVLVFRTRTHMRKFYRDVLPAYSGKADNPEVALGKRTLGCVCTLVVTHMRPDDPEDVFTDEIDQNYFCLVLLAEGFLTPEVLCHEAVHVGFAWDRRTRGESFLSDPHDGEENVCYPAGRFYAAVREQIAQEGLS
jgi:hypothetical protein